MNIALFGVIATGIATGNLTSTAMGWLVVGGGFFIVGIVSMFTDTYMIKVRDISDDST